MRLRDRIRRMTRRLRRAWTAYKGITPKLRRFDDLDDDEQSDFKRQLRQTFDEDEAIRQQLMRDLEEEATERINELNDAFRGEN